MEDVEDKQPPSNVRSGLALICIGAIGMALGYAGRQNDPDSYMGGPTVGETVAEIVSGFGLLFVLIGLALVAWGLLRD